MISKARTIGFPAFWWLTAGALGLLLQYFFLSHKVRELGVYTLPELSERLIGKEIRLPTSLIVVIAWLGIIAAQFVAGAKLLSLFTNISPSISIIITAFVIIFYSIIGGQSSVIKTDKVQFAILAIALIYTLLFLFNHKSVPISSIRFDLVNEKFTLHDLTYYLCIIGGSYFVCPLLFSRLFAARNASQAKKASLFSALGLLLFSFIITLIGMWASVHLDESFTGNVLGFIIKDQLPPFGKYLLLLGVISAIISSADTCLFAVASIIDYDILKAKKIKTTRIVIAIVGVFAALLALNDPDIISLLIQAYAIFTAGIVPPIAVALIMWKKKTIHSHWCICALCCGGALGLIANLTQRDTLALIGMALSTLLSIIGLYVPQKKNNIDLQNIISYKK